MLSWVGFWINEHSVPARFSLGITTVLAITTLLFGVQASLPKVGYIKAIDFYLLGSFLFVFGALVEFAVICTVTDLREEKSRVASEGNNDSTRDPSTILACGFSSPSMVFKEPKVRLILQGKILIFNRFITFFLQCFVCYVVHFTRGTRSSFHELKIRFWYLLGCSASEDPQRELLLHLLGYRTEKS